MSQSGFQYMVQRGKSAALRMADRLTPVLKDSKFRETGVITPEEFVAAGDNLVYHCPTWSWESGDPSKKKSYLPDNKQFLVTKNVPCYRRCHQMEMLPENEKVIKLTDDDEGWVDTHHGVAIEQIGESVQEMKLDQSSNTPQMPTVLPVMPNQPLVGGGDDDDDDDDDEPVEAILQEDDPAVLSKPTPVMTTPMGGAAATPSGGIMQTRTYDLNITYDNYYRTPRLWLFGYDEHQKPLSEEQMYEDISQDHLNKTVTLEDHPHLPPPSRLSVHPCRHADVMKKIMKMIEEDGRLLEVHSYLLVFLKFVQAVIPTIEYDYTQHLALVSA